MTFNKVDPETYFGIICRKNMDEFLFNFGLNKVHLSDSNSVLYEGKDVFLEFQFWPEDSPKYVVMPIMGLEKSVSEIGLWKVLPPNKEKEIYSQFEFQNEIELENVFIFLRDSIFQKYIAQYLLDQKKLLEIIQM